MKKSQKYIIQSALWLSLAQSALAQQFKQNYLFDGAIFGGREKFVSQAQPRHSLVEQVQAKGFAWGSPVFLRVFKKENVLELWMQGRDGRYQLFRNYPICVYSGDLGPKIQVGDKQSPEGVYQLDRSALRPQSRYHRALELNFPNTFDRAHGRTGKYLMIHGGCSSVGCYAMGDGQIEEIYRLTESALQHGQSKIEVHAFPFRLTREQLNSYKFHPQHDFWTMLAPIYHAFETMRVPPMVKVSDKMYLLMKPHEIQMQMQAQAQMPTQVAQVQGVQWQPSQNPFQATQHAAPVQVSQPAPQSALVHQPTSSVQWKPVSQQPTITQQTWGSGAVEVRASDFGSGQVTLIKPQP